MLNNAINPISQGQADLIKSFAIFYLMIVGNFIDTSIFTCSEINYIQKNIWLQLTIAFFLFYFLVTLVSNTGTLELTPPIEKLFYSIFYFIGFFNYYYFRFLLQLKQMSSQLSFVCGLLLSSLFTENCFSSLNPYFMYSNSQWHL